MDILRTFSTIPLLQTDERWTDVLFAVSVVCQYICMFRPCSRPNWP